MHPSDTILDQILELLLSHKKEKALQDPSPSASASYPHACAKTLSEASEPAAEHPSPPANSPPAHPCSPLETPAPRNRRHIPLEEILATQVRAKWLTNYLFSLLRAQPEDLSPLDIAYLQQRGNGKALQTLWQSPAADPSTQGVPEHTAPHAYFPESSEPPASLLSNPFPETETPT